MTSVYAPTQLYYLEGPTLTVTKKYKRGNAMDYIMRYSPLFAALIQKAGLEDWFDSDEFHSTCFIPCEEYSKKFIEHFRRADKEMARAIVTASVVPHYASVATLSAEESVPTCNRLSRLRISQEKGRIILNENLRFQRTDILLKNGLIQSLNGLVRPTMIE